MLVDLFLADTIPVLDRDTFIEEAGGKHPVPASLNNVKDTSLLPVSEKQHLIKVVLLLNENLQKK